MHTAREIPGTPGGPPWPILLFLSRLSVVPSGPEDALAMLIETGDDTVAVGFADESIAGFRPTGCQGVIKIGGLQPGFSTPIH
jgi:hypothetical protein